MSRVLLWSGGVDCLASLAVLEGKVDVLLYVDTGSRYSRVEMECARNLAAQAGMLYKFRCANARYMGEFEKASAEIPYRNAMLGLIASMYGDKVFLSIEAGTEENDSKDRNPEFFEKLNVLLCAMSDKRPKVVNALAGVTKQEGVAFILDYFPFGLSLLSKTYSCYRGGNESCNACPACVRKWFALKGNGIELNRAVRESDVFLQYVKSVREGKYASRRGEEYKQILIQEGLL